MDQKYQLQYLEVAEAAEPLLPPFLLLAKPMMLRLQKPQMVVASAGALASKVKSGQAWQASHFLTDIEVRVS